MSGEKDKTYWDAVGSTSSSTKKRTVKVKASRKGDKARATRGLRKSARTRR